MKKSILPVVMFLGLASVMLPGCAQIPGSNASTMVSPSKEDLRLLVVFDAADEYVVMRGRLLTFERLRSMLEHSEFSREDEVTLHWPQTRLTEEESERVGVFWKRVIDLFASHDVPLGIAFQIREK